MANPENTYYTDLVSRYLSGNASDKEVVELEEWVSAAPGNKALFMEAKKTWMLTGMEQLQPVNVDQLWEKTASQLFGKGKVVDITPKPMTSQAATIQADSPHPIVNRRRWWTVAAAIVLLAAVGIWFFQPPGDTGPLLVATTTESQTVDLSDGSVVTLNQASSIHYAVENDSMRKVDLQGDAFFEVARDETKPFVIETETIEIEVLGTSFYVDARENQEEVQVAVESGQVAVRVGDREEILVANEKAIFQKNTQTLLKKVNEDLNFTTLKTGILVFDHTPLKEVVFSLNRQYRANIVLENEALNECELSSTFNNLSIEAILTVLESSFEVEVKREADQVMLRGSCGE